MLHDLQLTAIFVTHDQEDAFAIADRVAMLQRGELLQIGTPEALYFHSSGDRRRRAVHRSCGNLSRQRATHPTYP